MDIERWQKIEVVLQDALDLPPDEREAFVHEKCGDDEDLRREVEKLIARYEQENSFLESPVWTDSQLLHSDIKKDIASSLEEMDSQPDEKYFIGRQIGVYRLTEELGRGGMGMVFLAERADGEFRQKVAIKLIKRGMDTDFILRRFRQERQIAAELNHPNIARLVDGGTTNDGAPYFVMEYVEGSPFFKYVTAHNLNLREKLELFLQVCRAVAYAHKKLIIHRDIKPGNILVTDDGEPKLLDFGIAKIVDPDLIHESAMPTATQMRLMTPEYASPEQVRGDEITPASDQYSLGVLLYELLTGNRPYKFPSRAPHEIARVICEEMPSEPSSGNFEKFILENAELSAFDQDFCRKLDRLVLKSLRKNPSERYASIKDFIDDIERFFRNEPVRAESFASDGNTFEDARKNNTAPAVADQKSIAVLPFKIVATLSEIKNVDDEFLGIGLADALITRLSNVRQFLVRPTSSILSYRDRATDSFAAGADLKVQFVLDGSIIKTESRIRVSVQLLNVAEQTTVWAERFDERLTDVLTLEDSISQRIADFLVPQMSGDEQRQLGKRGTDNADAYEAYLRGRYHWNLFNEEGFRQAIAFYEKAVTHDPNYAAAHASIAEYYVWLGIYTVLPPAKAYEAAKRHARRAIELDPNVAEAYAALGMAQIYADYDWEQGEQNMMHALRLNEANATAHLWCAYPLLAASRFDEGIRHLKRAIELDPTSFAAQVLAYAHYFARRFDDALDESRRILAQIPGNAYMYSLQTSAYRMLGRTEEALAAAQRVIEVSSDSPFFAAVYAQTLAATGDRAGAERIASQLEESSRTTDEYVSFYLIAVIYCFLDDKERAFAALDRAFALRDGLLVWIDVEHSFDALLRDDPRFGELLRKINFPVSKTIYKNAGEEKTLIQDLGQVAENQQTNPVSTATNEMTRAPRRTGIKQGVFLMILSILMLIMLIVPVSAGGLFSPLYLILFCLSGFGVGLIRILYALLFEPKIVDAPVATEDLTNQPKRYFSKRIKYALATAALTIFGFGLYHIVSYSTFDFSDLPPSALWKNSFAAMNLKRLTTSGKARRAILSPDGGKAVYLVEDGGLRSLWISSTDANDARQLVAPDSAFYNELEYSPDGNYIYYTLNRTPVRTLYRVPINGGAPEKISGNVLNLFALAPDGRRIVYESRNSDNYQNSLFIAELDGNGQIESAQTLFVLEKPNYFPGSISFSPDGEKIVYPRSVVENKKETIQLFVYDLKTNMNERLGDKGFDRLDATDWRRDANEIVISARESDSAPHQLWVVAYPSGEVSRLTNDFTDYYGVSLTTDSTALATIKMDLTSNIWTSEVTESNKNYESKVKRITGGVDRRDGHGGLSWTGDGRILYTTGAGAERGIALMNADGTENRLIPTGAFNPRFPMLSSDNRFLVYADKKGQEPNIWRFNMSGGTSAQMSTKFAVTPSVSPDNRSAVYAMMLNPSSNRLTIHRQPLDGGEETALTGETSVRPVVSPNGRFVACNYASEETNKVWQIAVLPIDKNSPPKIIQPYKNNFFVSPQERPLAWSPDGRFLYFLNTANNIANIFRVAVEGDAAPVQVTHFTSDEIFDFALAPDGKSFALARGATAGDVVIFQKTR